jgi:chromosome segregation ATPase
MSMHQPQDWHGTASKNMDHARTMQDHAHRQNETSFQAHEATMGDNMSSYNDVQTSMKQKVHNSYRLIDTLQKRAGSLENSIQQAQKSLADLEDALRAKDPSMQLCMHRLEKRERRPHREMVQDKAEEKLEDEKTVLMDTQKRLSDSIKRTKNMIHDLEGKLKEVRHDLDHKTQALSIDETCLRSTMRSYQTVMELTGRAAMSPAGRVPIGHRNNGAQAAMQESHKNELSRQQGTSKLNQAAAAMEEQNRALREDSKKVILRCQKAADDAVASSEHALQERVNDSQQMKRRLEAELAATNNKIDHTRNTIAETRAQIKALDEPIDNTSTCQSYRQQRATKEHIVDPVTTNLNRHQQMVLRARDDLVAHNEKEKDNLRELQERRDRLSDDIRDKTCGLHIDLDCLSHSTAGHLNGKPSMHLSKTQLNRSLKVDPRFVPTPGAMTASFPMSTRASKVGRATSMPLSARGSMALR